MSISQNFSSPQKIWHVHAWSELPPLLDDLREILVGMNFSDDRAEKIVLVVDEMISNVLSYSGFSDLSVSFFQSTCQKRVDIVLQDDGLPFDPTQYPVTFRATEVSLDKRKIGGWGIPFMRAFSTYASYERCDNKNILKLVFM